MIKQLLITLFTLTQFTFAQNYGTLRFTNYADDRKSAFSLTFDDGLLSQIENVNPILNQYGFKGTFYVLPPYLTETLPGIWRYGTWPGFQMMAAEGHEIGSHTMNHYDLTSLLWGDVNDDSTLLYELYQSKIFIEQKIPNKKCISLNYPYTIHNSIVDSAASLFYENGRTLGQLPNDSSLTPEEWFSLKAKVVLFDLPRNSIEDDLDELFTFLEWTQNSINNRKWGMIIIHDVVPFTQLHELLADTVYEPVTNEWLTSLCDFLWSRSSDKEVWVETVGNITRYIKERDAAEYQIISSSNQLIEITLTDNLIDVIYNYPLSAYIKVPGDWNYVRLQQGSFVDTLEVIEKGIDWVVLAKITPDKGLISLTPVNPTTVENEIVSVDKFELYQNYPNPFNPGTIISWQSPVSSWQTLKVYDVLGNEVATLVDEYKSAGMYNVQFTMHNQQLSSGLYFYQLKAGDYSETKKMMYLK
ncbi:MAG TPA: hypothetical protein DHV28_03215 [Ignavibacteriales bacterium]|nr:hypothetical protein [Ignavibacteriales bacterium]